VIGIVRVDVSFAEGDRSSFGLDVSIRISDVFIGEPDFAIRTRESRSWDLEMSSAGPEILVPEVEIWIPRFEIGRHDRRLSIGRGEVSIPIRVFNIG
jgi:hypothetical protein